MLSANEIVLIIIILTTLALIAFSHIAVELIALLILLVLNFSGIIDSGQALSGFSSTVVITLIGLFVITHALEETGVIQWVATKLNRIGGKSEVRLITLFMAAGAMLSLVMNNVAAGAVLLPAVVQVAQVSKVRASKLLIPMSFGTLIGGMATYLTTANIVMSELLRDRGLPGLNMLDFIPTGGLIVIASVVYMVLVGRRLLPERESITQATTRENLQQTYKLDERMWSVRVSPKSRLANTRLSESKIGEELGLSVLAISHGRQKLLPPGSDQMIYPGDQMVLLGRRERIEMLLEWGTELLNDELTGQQIRNFHFDLTEVIIPPRSTAIDRTLEQLTFRSRWGLTVIALWREGRSYRTDVGKMPLRVGDALLVAGHPARVQRLADNVNYIIPHRGYPSYTLRPDKAILSILITAIVVFIAILELLPLPEVMLSGAVAMVLTGCLEMRAFYEAIEWRVIFLIAGMLPLSIAMSETGLATRIGAELFMLLSGYSPRILIAGMFILSMLVTQIIGGQVSALIIGPIAINSALQMGIDPSAMAVAIAIACSTAFLTPIAHPVNILMMGPGGYNFGDFFKVGLGMTMVTLLTLLIAMDIFWNIH